ncbi:MAG: glyceraldehyde-3-phosphate dehydrogenase, partial [Bacteroidota bacterium]
MSPITSYEKELAFQADRRKATTEFIKIISDLWYDKSIEVVLFKNQIIDKNVSDIINLHEYAGEFVQKPISIFDSVEILRAINDIKLPPSKLDIGKLTYEYHADNNNYHNVKAFVLDKLKDANTSKEIKPKDVVLYGFGVIYIFRFLRTYD